MYIHAYILYIYIHMHCAYIYVHVEWVQEMVRDALLKGCLPLAQAYILSRENSHGGTLDQVCPYNIMCVCV